jgi:tartrate-resistant acid phosphatase type 5
VLQRLPQDRNGQHGVLQGPTGTGQRGAFAGTVSQEIATQGHPEPRVRLCICIFEVEVLILVCCSDNFYWNGLGSDDVSYRFLNSFETMYSDPALLGIKWFNVVGNHDIGGSMFICGKRDNEFVECSGTADLLKQLDEKFTRQSTYVSPNNDRWQMPDRYYVERLEDPDSGVSVDVFNIDTNAAAVHGAQQTCCQCYGYKMKYGGSQSCSNVARGDQLCAGGDTLMFDACMAQIEAWQADSIKQLARDAANSTATWKVVNTHYSPHFHMDPTMMAEVNSVLDKGGIHLFINGHTHAESHEFGSFNTHFVTNGAGGGIQSESIGEPPPYATDIKPIWRGENAPYGIFELSFGADQMKLQFVTFDDNWVFASRKADTVKGGAKLGHCWFIPKDGSLGEAC